MPEIEIDPEALEGAFRRAGYLDRIKPEELDAFREELSTKLNTLGINGEMKFDIEKNRVIVDGKEFDFKKVSKMMEEGDIMGAFEELGGPFERIRNNPEFANFAQRYENTMERSPARVAIKESEPFEEAGKKTTAVLGTPENEKEFESVINKTSDIKGKAMKDISDLEDKAKEAEGKGSKIVRLGKWIKESITIERILKIASLGLVGVGAYLLYKMIKEHQDAMNGCWLIKSNGDKCKVSLLTCDSDARGQGDICPPVNECGVKNTDPCFSTKTCIHYAKDNTCDKYLEQCSSGDCSDMCSCDKIDCPQGATLVCKNADFWEAASDLIGKPIDWVSGFAGGLADTLKKVLTYLIIGIGVVVFIMIIMWLIKKLVSGRKEGEHSVRSKGKSKEEGEELYMLKKVKSK